MKKIMLKAAALCLMLMCGVNADAQLNLGNIVGSVLNGSSSSDASNVISNLTSVFSSSKQASKESIVGTWEYEEPAIVLHSDNVLTNAAAKIAANSLEKKLQNQLSKYGIKKGSLKFTFKEDGTFTETLGKKTMTGNWQVKDSKLLITYLGIRQQAITTQLSGKKLLFVTDASKILSLMKSLSKTSTNSGLQTISSLMKSVDGMQAGLTLVKK